MNAVIHKVLLVLISLNAAALFVLPFSTVFSTETNAVTGEWINLYLLEDVISLLFCLPFVLLWCILLLKPLIISKPVFIFLLLFSALITFICALCAVFLPAQDSEPNQGVIAAAFLFPLLVLFIINKPAPDQKISAKKQDKAI